MQEDFSRSAFPIADRDCCLGKSTMPTWDMTEDIVITGMSGRFPECDNVEEFKNNLYNKVDMVTDYGRRWKPGLYGLPHRQGTLKDLSKFDAQFFGVLAKQTNSMDPQLRILLEVTYEAIADAGYEANSLRGQKIGVFVGCNAEDATEAYSSDIDNMAPYSMIGCSRTMFSNRLSYAFDFRGPSYTLDTACSSSLYAFQQAITSMRTGQCVAAIVAGFTLTLKPMTSMYYNHLKFLSPDGKCKAFDVSADGYVRSETVSAVLLQKSSAARRIYATVVHAKCNADGAKTEGITFPSGVMQKSLLSEVLNEAMIDPNEISYVETHGTGTQAGDPQELNSITDVICKGRRTPLLIGSVKSNMGHSEAASGMNQLVKVLLAMEEGVIPPNLHFKCPNPEIPALLDGRLKVVTENTPWNGGLVSINNFGFGGANANVLLKSNVQSSKQKRHSKIPRLAICCGRTKDTTESILQKVGNNNYPEEGFVLLEELAKAPTSGMPYRGYALIKIGTEDAKTFLEKSPEVKMPLWFVFSGMGSQWAGMAKDMMRIDIFANSIRQSAEVLKRFHLDLLHLLTQSSDEEFEKITVSFVTITAIQIALVDLARSLDIVPDGMVGHSMGELVCAYASNCFTSEQAILASYWRGKVCEEIKLPYGAMAAVGLTWEEAHRRCPKGIVPACHNSEDSVTISGPADAMERFVKELQSEGIFARGVKSCDIAFHSCFMSPVEKLLHQEMKKFISKPKLRPTNWICSSITQNKWNEPLAKFSSADYFVNNLLSPVLFHDAMSHVPSNAVVIEFAPHTLMQAILKRSLGSDSIYIGLMKRGNAECVDFFFSAVGKLYTSGFNPSVKHLYPTIEFPVPRGTPRLSHLIHWDHSSSWRVPNLEEFAGGKSPFEMVIKVDVSTPNTKDYYLTGHCIDGRVLFPAMGYLLLAWKAVAKTKQLNYREVPVVFENIALHRATILPKTGSVKFIVSLVAKSGQFEISEGSTVVVTGKVYVPDKPIQFHDDELRNVKNKGSEVFMDCKDVYKELRLRGYEYGKGFQGLTQANFPGNWGNILWNGNYVTFMDTMLHLVILSNTTRSLYLPTRIRSVKIDPRAQPSISEGNHEADVSVAYNSFTGEIFAGGVQMKGLECSIAPRRQLEQRQPILEGCHYVPNFEPCILENEEKHAIKEYIQVCSSMARKVLELNGKCLAVMNESISRFEEVSEKVLRFYTASCNENFVLFSFLKNVFDVCASGKNVQENAKCLLQKYEKTLHKDILSNVLLNERALRNTLDLVLENQTSLNVRILEVSPRNSLHNQVLQILQSYHVLLHPTYTVAHPSSGYVSEEENGVIQNVVWNLRGPGPKEMDILIAKDVLTTSNSPTSVLQSLKSAVKENGFIVLIERSHISPAEKFLSMLCDSDLFRICNESIESICNKAGLTIIAKKSDELTGFIYLLRNLPQNNGVVKKHIIRLQMDSFSWVDELKATMKDYQGKPDGDNIWIVAEDNTSGIVGLVNCLRKEPGGHKIRCVFTKTTAPEFDHANVFYEDMMKKDLVTNVYNHGQWGSFRHVGIKQDSETESFKQIPHAFLNILTRGDLSSLKWVESPLKYWPANCTNKAAKLCHVYYAPLNFRDVMLATGKLAADAISGDFALQECILGIEFSGRDESGKRVMGLVPASSMATEVVADPDFLWDVPEHWTLEQACTVPAVYATVYYALVIRGGLQSGESVLIHSGSGGVGQAAIAIALSMECQVFTTVGSLEKRDYLKKRFPQLVDQNFCNSHSITFENDIATATNGKGLSAFLGNISFHGILLDSMFGVGCTHNAKRKIVDLLSEGIKSGVVQPLETTIFTANQAEEAFRFMASGRHIGKVVIKLREEESQKMVVSRPIAVGLPAILRTLCHPCKSYIIAGGLGGFGLELANWLVDRGCRKLVLTSRTRQRSGYQNYCLKRWKVAGVEVLVSIQNVTTTDGTKALLNEASKLGPIGAIFNLTMVLQDAFLENLTQQDFCKVCDPKIVGTQNLDKLSRQFCRDIDWFVVFSSVVCGRGNAGQSNYGYANSVMERICEQRQRDGLPALAIQWGAVGDVGMVQETFGRNDVIISGSLPQRITSCMATLDIFMQRKQRYAVVSSFVPAEHSEGSKVAARDKDLLSHIGRILGIEDFSVVNRNVTLGELGMDSLMGTEVMQLLGREYECAMTNFEVQNLSIMKLQEMEQTLSGRPDQTNQTTTKPVIEQDKVFSFRYLIPKEVIVPLNKATGTEPVFIVHPVDGVVDDLITVCSLLTNPSYGLQCTLDIPQDSIQDMAHYYLQEMCKIQPHGPYHICGYSFGALVAFEMAVMLQKRKKDDVKSLIFLDASPEYVCFLVMKRARRLEHMGKDSRIVALASVAMDFTENIVELTTELSKLQSWDAQLGKVADMVMNNCSSVPYKKHDIQRAAESYAKKCASTYLYVKSGNFKGKATLIKASKSFHLSTNLGADYGLGKIIDGNVELHAVEGDHRSFLQGDSAIEVARLINIKTKL